MDVASQKRGKNVAIIGLVLQLLMAAAMLVIWRTTWSLAAMAATWMLAGGLLMWLMAMVLFYCRQLQRQEALELEEIAVRAASGSIFERDAEASLHVAANRLRWVMRWLAPASTLAFAAFHAVIAMLMLRYLSSPHLEFDATPQKTLIVAIIFSIMAVFLGFLVSRYATGMGRHETYRPMRAVGNYLLICMVGAAGVVAGLAFAYWDNIRVDLVLACAIAGVQIVLAAELAMNFIMDIYRPRVPGQEQRLAFDSRVLGLIAEPGRVGHSIAEAMNYQFGFDVSKTWFYQLLGRAIAPMLVVAVVILLALSSIVLIPEGRTGVLLHLGKVQRQLEPGAHLKWPWPVDRVDQFDTRAVHGILLGAGRARTKEELKKNIVNGHELYLWSQEHGQQEEMDFLVGMPPQSRTDTKGWPVNVIKLVVEVQYRIEDPIKFGYKYDDGARMLLACAQQQMVEYLAGATLFEKLPDPNQPQAIMTEGAQKAAQGLRDRINRAAGPEGLDLGVELKNVAIIAAHPPSGAAEAYEKVQQAQLQQQQSRYEAQGEANKILAQVAGSPSAALRLAFAIRRLNDLQSVSLATGAERAARARDYLDVARTDLLALEGDIERDRLIGRAPFVPASAGQATSRPQDNPQDKQLLKLEYEQFLAQLQRIADDPRQDLAAAVRDASKAADDLLELAGGQPAARVAQARADRWKTELTARASAESFGRELAAYRASPRIYKENRYMDVWDKILPGMTKFVLAVDPSKVELRVNMEKPNEPMQGILTTPK